MFFPSVGDGIPDVTAPVRTVSDNHVRFACEDTSTHQWALFRMGKISWHPLENGVSFCVIATITQRDTRLAGAPSTINPTRRLGGPSFRCTRTASAPINLPISFCCFPI